MSHAFGKPIHTGDKLRDGVDGGARLTVEAVLCDAQLVHGLIGRQPYGIEIARKKRRRVLEEEGLDPGHRPAQVALCVGIRRK